MRCRRSHYDRTLPTYSLSIWVLRCVNSNLGLVFTRVNTFPVKVLIQYA